MNQGINQRLTNGFMNDGIPLTEQISIQLERNLQVCRQALTDLQVKLKQIASPGSIRHQAIRPAYIRIIRQLFTIIDMILRQGFAQGLVLTKHQQTGNRQSFNAQGSVFSPSTQLGKKPLIIFTKPGMGRFKRGESMAILLQTG